MKPVQKVLLGLSLFVSVGLYANEDHMKNHMNMDGMSTKQMQDTEMNSYHHNMMINGYSITLSSKKPLTDGRNQMSIKLMQNKKEIKNADISINFSMPSMPGMEFTEHAKENGDIDINFSMAGEWAYELIFKTSDGITNKLQGSVNIK